MWTLSVREIERFPPSHETVKWMCFDAMNVVRPTSQRTQMPILLVHLTNKIQKHICVYMRLFFVRFSFFPFVNK